MAVLKQYKAKVNAPTFVNVPTYNNLYNIQNIITPTGNTIQAGTMIRSVGGSGYMQSGRPNVVYGSHTNLVEYVRPSDFQDLTSNVLIKGVKSSPIKVVHTHASFYGVDCSNSDLSDI